MHPAIRRRKNTPQRTLRLRRPRQAQEEGAGRGEMHPQFCQRHHLHYPSSSSIPSTLQIIIIIVLVGGGGDGGGGGEGAADGFDPHALCGMMMDEKVVERSKLNPT